MKDDAKMECIETAFELGKLHHIQTWNAYNDLLCMAVFEYQHLCNGFDYFAADLLTLESLIIITDSDSINCCDE